VGASLREQLVTDLHLDCTVGRPCVIQFPGTVMKYSDKKLTGSIPPEIREFTSLKELWLYGNELTGSIPPQMSALTALSQLYLSGNKLTSSIPPDIREMTALAMLSLSTNELASSIPPEMGDMTALTSLFLNNNKLTGAIPRTLTLLTKTTKFRLDSNPGLCHLDAGLTMCTTVCPLQMCAVCQSSDCSSPECSFDLAKDGSYCGNNITVACPQNSPTCCLARLGSVSTSVSVTEMPTTSVPTSKSADVGVIAGAAFLVLFIIVAVVFGMKYAKKQLIVKKLRNDVQEMTARPVVI
jgi:hypothetical protein